MCSRLVERLRRKGNAPTIRFLGGGIGGKQSRAPKWPSNLTKCQVLSDPTESWHGIDLRISHLAWPIGCFLVLNVLSISSTRQVWRWTWLRRDKLAGRYSEQNPQVSAVLFVCVQLPTGMLSMSVVHWVLHWLSISTSIVFSTVRECALQEMSSVVSFWSKYLSKFINQFLIQVNERMGTSLFCCFEL